MLIFRQKSNYFWNSITERTVCNLQINKLKIITTYVGHNVCFFMKTVIIFPGLFQKIFDLPSFGDFPIYSFDILFQFFPTVFNFSNEIITVLPISQFLPQLCLVKINEIDIRFTWKEKNIGRNPIVDCERNGERIEKNRNEKNRIERKTE